MVKCVYSISLRMQPSLLASHAASRDLLRERRCPSRKLKHPTGKRGLHSPIPLLCLLPVTESFVFKQLKGLKVKKATGLDRIPACLLKDSAAVITQSITFLVNLSLTTGIVPNVWKQARVVPLHKSGGREVMDNYRPISILPVTSKIAEKAVNVQLQQYVNQHGLLNSSQSRFRRHHSTQTAVTYFCDTIRRTQTREN